MMQHVQQNSLPKVFVTGDLNIDYVATGVALGRITRVAYLPPAVGGSAYNAATAFKRAGFRPIVFGKVGSDANGDLILSALKRHEVDHLIDRDEARPTGACNLIFFQAEEHPRTIYYWDTNANDYDLRSLGSALKEADLGGDDLIFSPLHIYEQTNRDHRLCRAFFDELRASQSKVIVDIVPHMIYEVIGVDALREIIGGPVFMMIGEYRTFMNLIMPGADVGDATPTQADCVRIAQCFEAEYFSCRYGIGNISRELIFRRTRDAIELVGPSSETGYEHLPDAEKRGFGDHLTASTLSHIIRARGQERTP